MTFDLFTLMRDLGPHGRLVKKRNHGQSTIKTDYGLSVGSAGGSTFFSKWNTLNEKDCFSEQQHQFWTLRHTS